MAKYRIPIPTSNTDTDTPLLCMYVSYTCPFSSDALISGS